MKYTDQIPENERDHYWEIRRTVTEYADFEGVLFADRVGYDREHNAVMYAGRLRITLNDVLYCKCAFQGEQRFLYDVINTIALNGGWLCQLPKPDDKSYKLLWYSEYDKSYQCLRIGCSYDLVNFIKKQYPSTWRIGKFKRALLWMRLWLAKERISEVPVYEQEKMYYEYIRA